MASTRRAWADEDEDEDEDINTTQKSGTRFETGQDKDGIKTVVEYTEKNNQTYKVTRKIKVTVIPKRTNPAIEERKSMKKFGKAAINEEKKEAMMVIRSEEEIPIEASKKNSVQLTTKDDAEDKFYEDSLNVCEGLFKEKKAWTAASTKDGVREEPAAGAAPAAAAPAASPEPAAPAPGAPAKYVPPTLRTAKGEGKGGGKEGGPNDQEASLRVTNLSEDCREGDLQDLFAQCGRLQRVYLAKDMTTQTSRGFAFITYHTREDAQRAINKLHGHGYDNLILQVQFAKPRT